MAKKVTEVVMGKRYRDKVHGIEGVATSATRYLTGCDRIGLEFVKDGEVKHHVVDVTQLEGVEVAKADRKPGGPGAVVPRRSSPSRDPR